jgi:transposase
MKRDDLLIKKVNCLLKRVGAPTHLNRYGPKKYFLAEKVYALFLRSEWKASFRRTKQLCNSLAIPCPSKSTLHYILTKLPWDFIKNMLKSTITRQPHLAAVDGTGLSRNRLSEHYVLRAGINIKKRKHTKLSIFIDTRNKKILSGRFRKNLAHDIKDVKYLIKNSLYKPKKVVADKGYDAEWFRAFLAEQGIDFCIPTKGKVSHGHYRKRNKCDQRTYRRRPIVESSIFRLKQLFGRSVSCVLARNMRAEVFIRIILYNLSIKLRMI